MKKIALTALITLLSTSTYASDFKLVVPHVTNPDSYNHQSLEVFKNAVESRSNGRITVDIYPSGQLCGNAKECLAGVQAGMFDYFQTTVSEMAYYWKPMEGFDLPYLLTSDRIAECTFDDIDMLADIRNAIIKATGNLRVMMISNSGGWRNIATTKKQVKTPADMKGLKMRTVPAPIQQDLMKSFSAAPTPVSWPETYTALSTGVVDGTGNSVVDITTMNFQESVKYMTLDGHAYMGGLWVMNNDKFKSLPDDLKRVVIDAVHAQNQFLRVYPKWKEFSSYEVFKKAGGKVYNPSADEKSQFVEAAKPVRDAYMARASADQKSWLARFESVLATCEANIAKENEMEAR